jgi:hypothetical protein
MLCAACVWMFQEPSGKGTHHHSYDNLAKAAELGCKICIYLQLLRERLGPDEEAEKNHPITTYSFRRWGASFRAASQGAVKLQSPASWLNNPFQSRLDDMQLHISKPGPPPQWWQDFLETVSCDLMTEPWKVREDNFGTRPVSESTGDPSVMELGLEWLETCRNSHAQCEAVDETRQPGYYPSRLLDVGTLESNILRLLITEVEPPAQGHRYATLSHCWGNASFIQLTAENVASLNTEIPPECLPQSFTDAIITCRRLRIRYLWIDSLCILQSGPGSNEDWQFHVGAMNVIYANCVLNLSIAHASSPEQGAFVTRNPSYIKTTCVYAPLMEGISWRSNHVSAHKKKRAKKPWDPASCSLVTIFVSGYNNLDEPSEPFLHRDWAGCDFASSLSNQPLSKRGWVFQERLMAPRMLSFGKDRIYWQCDERVLNEYLPHGLPGSGDMYDLHPRPPFTLADTVLRKQPPPMLTKEKSAYLYKSWYLLVDYYSETDLTYPEKDKLAAIAAIAGRYDRIVPGKYCAGIFTEPDMLLGFLWVSPRVVIRAEAPIASFIGAAGIILDPERSPEYRAPTWSWASVDGRVKYNMLVNANKKRPWERWQTLASVEGVSIELREPRNPYGQVLSAEVVINGVLLRGFRLNKNLVRLGLIKPYVGLEELVGLCLLEIKQDIHFTLCGIVLLHIGSNTYQRKGHFWIYGPQDGSRLPIEDLEKATVKII